LYKFAIILVGPDKVDCTSDRDEEIKEICATLKVLLAEPETLQQRFNQEDDIENGVLRIHDVFHLGIWRVFHCGQKQCVHKQTTVEEVAHKFMLKELHHQIL